MNFWDDIQSGRISIEELGKFPALEFGRFQLTIADLTAVVAVLVGARLIVYMLRWMIYRTRRLDEARKFTIYQLSHYMALLVAITTSLRIMGIDLSVLVAGSAALLVVIGFGLQPLFRDLVSGVVLLLDQSIRVGDIIDLNGIVARVERINFRTTQVTTADDKVVIVPNSMLATMQLINWTHHKLATRFDLPVVVAYDSDPKVVQAILMEIAGAHPDICHEPPPFARLDKFGDLGLEFVLIFWTERSLRPKRIKSDLRFSVLERFRAQGITIPVAPQLRLTAPDTAQK